MSTLSNVIHRGDQQETLCVGFTTNAPPDARILQAGVSVRYVYDSEKHWYVLRASYGREQKAYDYTINDNSTVYIPMRCCIKSSCDGVRKRIKKPLIPNLLFVYATPEQIEKYIKHTPSLSFLKYYYNHLINNPDGTNPPLTIDYKTMMNFIEITSIANEHIMLVNDSQCRFKCNDIVRITAGAFKGIEGRVARIAGQQRVVVTIKNLCSIATAYIPSAFLMKTNEHAQKMMEVSSSEEHIAIKDEQEPTIKDMSLLL